MIEKERATQMRWGTAIWKLQELSDTWVQNGRGNFSAEMGLACS